MARFQSKVKPSTYSDAEWEYVKKGFILEFYHIPTSKIVQFKAMLTQYEDKYESQWNHEPVYGRMDPISTFKGTKRVISLGWDVVAASEEEAVENLQRATLLFSMLYPTYASSKDSRTSTISSAPLFKLSFVNLIKDYGITPPATESPTQQQSHYYGENVFTEDSRPDTGPQSIPTSTPKSQPPGKGTAGQARSSGLVGSVDGFSFSPELEWGMFDSPTGLNAGKLYPKTIKLSCNFTVMHTHPLGWSESGEFRNPNFPYGSPIREIDISPIRVTENSGGGTDIQKSSKRNSITKQRKR
jgi:hypothetical protein